MFRSPWELDSYIRHHHEHLASERRRCSEIDRFHGRPPHLATQMRRRIGIGLMQVGAAIAGADALRGRSNPAAWPDFAHR